MSNLWKSYKVKALFLLFPGIKVNQELIKIHYPGWIMRIYFNFADNSKMLGDLCLLACENPESLDLCNVQNLPGTPHINASKLFPRIWRFFPILDPQVGGKLSQSICLWSIPESEKPFSNYTPTLLDCVSPLLLYHRHNVNVVFNVEPSIWSNYNKGTRITTTLGKESSMNGN